MDKSDAVDAISKKIDWVTSSLVEVKPSRVRLEQLDLIVDAAASLAMDIGKQRGLFKLEQPSNYLFDSKTMEEVFFSKNVDSPEGKKIRSVVFPAVTKWGNDEGVGYERSITILKAQVLV